MPRTGYTAIRLPDALKEAIKREASRQGRTISEVIRRALRQKFLKPPGPSPREPA